MTQHQQLLAQLSARNTAMRSGDFETAYQHLLNVDELALDAEGTAVGRRAAAEWQHQCGDALRELHPAVALFNAINAALVAKAAGDGDGLKACMEELETHHAVPDIVEVGVVDPLCAARAAIARKVLESLAA